MSGGGGWAEAEPVRQRVLFELGGEQRFESVHGFLQAAGHGTLAALLGPQGAAALLAEHREQLAAAAAEAATAAMEQQVAGSSDRHAPGTALEALLAHAGWEVVLQQAP